MTDTSSRARRRYLEFASQCALFRWARYPSEQKKYPGLDLLSSSLNGLHLSKSEAGKAKASGLLPGEYDIKLPVARGGYHGLAIELKYGVNKLTTEQEWYGNRLTEEGWDVACFWSWIEAKDRIIAYLTGKRVRA